MDWTIVITACFVISTAVGFWLLKDRTAWAWSLKRRIYLRSGAMSGLMNYLDLEAFAARRRFSHAYEKLYKVFRTYQQRKMDKEIFEAIIFLRNLASIEKGRSSSADSVIETLSENHGLLRPIFIKMLKLLRINQTKEAAALFSQRVGTTAGRDFAGLLIQWDRLEPSQLLETLISYEKSMKAVRLTEQKRRDEIVSDMIYFPVVINILVIFINFIFVAYFIDQKELLQMFV